MRQKQKKRSLKSPPSQARAQPPEEGLESFLEEIGVADEGDRKPAAADSWCVSAGSEGKDSDDDDLFEGYVEDDKLETEDEKGE